MSDYSAWVLFHLGGVLDTSAGFEVMPQGRMKLVTLCVFH
jgi:hypothetical protein